MFPTTTSACQWRKTRAFSGRTFVGRHQPKGLPCSRVVTARWADLLDRNNWWAWIIYTPKHLNTERSFCIMSPCTFWYFKCVLMLIFTLWGPEGGPVQDLHGPVGTASGLGSWRGASSHSWAQLRCPWARHWTPNYPDAQLQGSPHSLASLQALMHVWRSCLCA